MIIPPEQLSHETLISLIEEFISREGTDYGFVEMDLQTKTEMLKRQIDKGEVLIIFDAVSESVNLVLERDYSLER